MYAQYIYTVCTLDVQYTYTACASDVHVRQYMCMFVYTLHAFRGKCTKVFRWASSFWRRKSRELMNEKFIRDSINCLMEKVAVAWLLSLLLLFHFICASTNSAVSIHSLTPHSHDGLLAQMTMALTPKRFLPLPTYIFFIAQFVESQRKFSFFKMCVNCIESFQFLV